MRGGNALFRQPLAHHALCGAGIIAVGVGTEPRTQAQEQLLGHGVVTVFVDVANDLDQVRREGACQQAGTFRHAVDPVAALDGATQFIPDGPYRTGGIGRVVEQRQVGLRVAAVSQLTADHHGNAVCLGDRVVAHIAAALLAVDRLDLVVDADAGNRWFDRYQHLATVVAGDKAQGLEVDQQGVGLDQERLVFVAAVIIELGQHGLHEVAAVEHQVAADGLHPVGAQVAHQQPELFHVQFRVTATLEVEVALQGAVTQRAVAVELGLPLVSRAEQLQGRIGGDQLHGRGRVDRDVGIEHGWRARAVERQHHQRQGRVLQFIGFQRLLYFGGQRGVDGRGLGRQGNGQEQAGKQKRA
ncbi:hypothetical protein D3C77_127030 [compost metagenome]